MFYKTLKKSRFSCVIPVGGEDRRKIKRRRREEGNIR
jgi:hypothetical protein